MTLAMPRDLAAELSCANADPAARLARFKASQSMSCDSGYVCEDVEVGDRALYLPGPDGPIVLCETCADRLEAAADLAKVTPIRPELPEITAPRNVAEAELALTEEWAAFGQYRPETVRALLGLLDTAAGEVAAHERERWVTRIRLAARRGTALAEGTHAGLHMAASLIERNRETPA